MLRRSFMQILGLAPAAAVVAPTALVESAVTVPTVPMMGIGGSVFNKMASSTRDYLADHIARLTKKRAVEVAIKTARPAWWVEERRNQARYNALAALNSRDQYDDFGYRALKSVSPAAKRWMIEEAYKRAIEKDEGYYARSLNKMLWEQATGIYDDDGMMSEARRVG